MNTGKAIGIEKPEKAPVRKTVTKRAKQSKEVICENVYVQFDGKEIRTEELVEQVKEAWKAEGHRISSIKSLELYIKPEDMAAYYVVNEKTTGKIEL